MEQDKHNVLDEQEEHSGMYEEQEWQERSRRVKPSKQEKQEEIVH